MRKPDLVLLHPPSVYDFRTRPALMGPVSDVVPSSAVFEMYPIGFLTILCHLERQGWSVRILNVALRMMRSERFDAERVIRNLEPLAFGIDLHWLPHAHGGLALAGIVKKHHPRVPVIFGGLTASYYHEELARQDCVDCVLRGDSTEEPLGILLADLKARRSLENVPNLTWKDDGQAVVNALTHVPSDLDGVSFDYGAAIRSCVRHMDIAGHMPFGGWFRYPIAPVMTCRGCSNCCATCGGSAYAYRRICGRAAPAYRSPSALARDIAALSECITAPVMVVGDICQQGEEYAETFLEELRKLNVKNHLAFEFFEPPARHVLEGIAASAAKFNVQISPETHDEQIRLAFGKRYGNEALERCVADLLELGCNRVDLFFMIGLPAQTAESVGETLRYCDRLMGLSSRRGRPGRVHAYVAPLAPFLDPGSAAFEVPERHGYRLRFRSLGEHREALAGPSWKHALNYESLTMPRKDLVEATYDAAVRLAEMKATHGLIGGRAARKIAARVERERWALREIDRAMGESRGAVPDAELACLLRGAGGSRSGVLCPKREMEWPAGALRFKPGGVMRHIAGRARSGC